MRDGALPRWNLLSVWFSGAKVSWNLVPALRLLLSVQPTRRTSHGSDRVQCTWGHSWRQAFLGLRPPGAGQSGFAPSRPGLQSGRGTVMVVWMVWVTRPSAKQVTALDGLCGRYADGSGECGDDRSTPIRPARMPPPARYPFGDRASGLTGRRFAAALWDRDLPAHQASCRAGTLAR